MGTKVKRKFRAIGLLALGVSAWPGAAVAEGFYWRGGVGVDWSGQTQFTDADCASAAPAALYGCGTGNDGAPTRSKGDFGRIGGIEAGVGRPLAGPLRLEAAVSYRPDFNFDGRANFSQTQARQPVAAEASSVSVLLAGYFDLQAGSGPLFASMKPFIGAGLGISRLKIDQMRMGFPRTQTLVPGATQTEFTWMVTAGVAIPLGEKTTLDAAWRYLDSGDVETGQDVGQVVWRDGHRPPLEIDLAKTRAKLSSHGIQLTLRRRF